MVKPTSCKDLEELKKDEAMANKDYAERGFKSLSKDEKRHFNFLSKKEKKLGCK